MGKTKDQKQTIARPFNLEILESASICPKVSARLGHLRKKNDCFFCGGSKQDQWHSINNWARD